MSDQVMIFELELSPWSWWTSLPVDKQQVTGGDHLVAAVCITGLAVTFRKLGSLSPVILVKTLLAGTGCDISDNPHWFQPSC